MIGAPEDSATTAERASARGRCMHGHADRKGRLGLMPVSGLWQISSTWTERVDGPGKAGTKGASTEAASMRRTRIAMSRMLENSRIRASLST